jgi:hypothetical protein
LEQTKEKQIEELETTENIIQLNLITNQEDELSEQLLEEVKELTVLEKVKKHKWNILAGFAILLALILFLPIVINPNLKYAGRYNLTYLYDSYSEIRLSDYEYNYIELKKDGTYCMKNKANSVVTEQSGTYEVNKDVITFKSKTGGTTVTEEYEIEDEEIYITLWIGSREISFYFTKE